MSEIKSSNSNCPVKTVVLVNSSNPVEYDKALAQVRAIYMQAYTNQQYLGSDQKTLCKILDSDDLNVENEEVVFDSVRQWSTHNNIHSEFHINSLMKVVRLSLLPIEYLLNKVEPFVYPFKDSRDAFLNELRNRNIGDKKAMLRKYTKYQKLTLDKDVITKSRKTIYDSAKSSSKLLSIGSDNLNTANTVEIYDGNLNQWIKPKKLSINRINYSVSLTEDKVMLIGGTRSSHENTEPLNIVQSLDLSTGNFLTEASLNEPRQYAAAVGVNKGKMSFVCVFGGHGKGEDLDSVERWDAISRVWTYMNPMPSKRSGLAAAILDDKIYILGGKTGTNYTNTMEAYYQENGQWEAKAPMKEARAHFCVGISKGYMYAVAGSQNINLYINTVERYDPSVDSWITIANIMVSGHVAVSSLGNRLICAGRTHSKSTLEYDSESNNWLKLENMHEPRSGYLLQLPENINDLKFDWDDQTISRKLLMIENRESTTAKSLEIFDSITNQWTQLKDIDIDFINYSVVCVGDVLWMIGSASGENNYIITINLLSGRVSHVASSNNNRQQSATVIVNKGIFTFVYAIGGTTDGNTLKLVERWDSLSRTWTMVTPMATARTGHGAVLLQNKIYVVGGKTGTETYNKSVEVYDLENDIWTPKAPMNNANANFGMATFKNHIFVVGGNRDSATSVNSVERYDPAKDVWTTIANISSEGAVAISSMGNRLICAGGKSSNIVQEYDENDNKWLTLNPLNNKCSGILVELEPDTKIYSGDWSGLEKLIFLGGYHRTTQGENVETFDVVKKKWTQLKKLPKLRSEFNANLISNKLLIIGDIQEKYYSAVDAIDLSSGTIQSLPPLLEERTSTSSAVVTYENKQTLYVIGGYNSYKTHKFSSSVEKWDPLTNKWTEGIPMPTARCQMACVFSNGIIYAAGGWNDSGVLNILEAFSVKNNNWITKKPMNQKRCRFGMTVLKNKIYVAGGISNKTVERYDPDNDTWTTLADIKSNWKVGLCAFGDRLICAGGSNKDVQEYDVIRNRWISLSPKNVVQHGYLLQLPKNAILGNW